MLMKSVGWTEVDKIAENLIKSKAIRISVGVKKNKKKTLCDCETLNRSGKFPIFLVANKISDIFIHLQPKIFCWGERLLFPSNLVKLSSPNHSMRDEHNPCEIFYITFSLLCVLLAWIFFFEFNSQVFFAVDLNFYICFYFVVFFSSKILAKYFHFTSAFLTYSCHEISFSFSLLKSLRVEKS